MANILNSYRYSDEPAAKAVRPDWLRVGAVAAASALLGGLAVLWYYRKTLARLREAEEALAEPEIYDSVEDL